MTVKLKEKRVQRAVTEFVHRLLEKKRYKDKIKSILMYGSATKGKYNSKESDVDLLVVGSDYHIDEAILEIETEISLKYGLMLSVLFNTPQELKQIKNMGYPLFKEIEKGNVLYERS